MTKILFNHAFDPATYPIQAAIDLINHYAKDAEYRPYPFISHMTDVAYWTQQFTSDPELIAAAWLHDLVEDFDVTLPDLAEMGYSDRIVDIVWWLTDPDGGDRAEKKAKLYQMYKDPDLRINTINDGRLVKCCDRLANMTSCVRGKREKLAKRYIEEWDDFSRYIIHDTNGERMIPRRLWTLLLGALNSCQFMVYPDESI